MPRIKANKIEIEYETFGDPSNEALLLINGLGSQMINWFEDLIKQFTDSGFYVIRFDNRDVGLSTKFDDLGTPNTLEALKALQRGEKIKFNYTLDDMADDSVGLLDALNIEKAHLCGMSMGSFIAQTISYRHPSRVLSLTSILGSPGLPNQSNAKTESVNFLFSSPPEGKEAIIERSISVKKLWHGSGFPFDEERMRLHEIRAYERSYYPQGFARQLMAILAHGDRKPMLSSIKVPTLVIHGADDPHVPVEEGRDTAEAIPGAKLLIIDGMGHSIYIPETWPQIVEAIVKIASKEKKSE
ncbi:MAG: alpha/beta fold hydrolase [Promethearchaeota archaeon]